MVFVAQSKFTSYDSTRFVCSSAGGGGQSISQSPIVGRTCMLPFKVLILGEEGQDRVRLAEGLVAEGFSVTQSEDGHMAPVTLLANKVDLVLLDYDIPR